MPNRDAAKRNDRHRQPCEGEMMRSEDEPCQRNEQQRNYETQVAEPYVDLLETRDSRFADSPALNVFFRRKHWLKM